MADSLLWPTGSGTSCPRGASAPGREQPSATREGVTQPLPAPHHPVVPGRGLGHLGIAVETTRPERLRVSQADGTDEPQDGNHEAEEAGDDLALEQADDAVAEMDRDDGEDEGIAAPHRVLPHTEQARVRQQDE